MHMTRQDSIDLAASPVANTSSYIASFRPLRQHSHDSALTATFDLLTAARRPSSMMTHCDVTASNRVNLVYPIDVLSATFSVLWFVVSGNLWFVDTVPDMKSE